MTAFVQTMTQSCSRCNERGLVTAVVPHGMAQSETVAKSNLTIKGWQ